MTTDTTERQKQLALMERLKALGEKAYDDMYEAHSPRDADNFYREAKECYYDAIGLARNLGLKDEAEAMTDRLHHIKSVYRSQFT